MRGGKTLFSDLSFKVPAGKTLVIRGRNGSGKTSLLKILSGLLSPNNGEIKWRDKNINSDPFAFKNDLAYIGHKNGIKLQQTVSENLCFWRDVYHSENEKIEHAISVFGLDDVLDVPCYMLSAGWQRRVALSRFLLTSAKLWLMDEPTTNLDLNVKEILRDVIKKHSKTGGISIISTNDDGFTGKEINLDKYK